MKNIIKSLKSLDFIGFYFSVYSINVVIIDFSIYKDGHMIRYYTLFACSLGINEVSLTLFNTSIYITYSKKTILFMFSYKGLTRFRKEISLKIKK